MEDDAETAAVMGSRVALFQRWQELLQSGAVVFADDELMPGGCCVPTAIDDYKKQNVGCGGAAQLRGMFVDGRAHGC